MGVKALSPGESTTVNLHEGIPIHNELVVGQK